MFATAKVEACVAVALEDGREYAFPGNGVGDVDVLHDTCMISLSVSGVVRSAYAEHIIGVLATFLLSEFPIHHATRGLLFRWCISA